jgi:hypothetical protein
MVISYQLERDEQESGTYEILETPPMCSQLPQQARDD